MRVRGLAGIGKSWLLSLKRARAKGLMRVQKMKSLRLKQIHKTLGFSKTHQLRMKTQICLMKTAILSLKEILK